MPQNNTDVVGRKSGKLLQGLLMGLYGISGVEANPEYLAPGVEGPIGQGDNLPFKGVGAFGGLKAKGANAEFIGQNALADAAAARNIAMLPRKLAIENEAALNLARGQNTLEQENLLTAKGNQGAALGTAMAELPYEQLKAMGVPATFSSPQQQFDWYNQAYGAQTPLVKAPGIAAEQSNIYNLERNPLTLANRQQAEINKGNIQLGGSIFNPSAPEGQQYIRGDSWQPYQETVEVPTGEMTLGADGQLVPKMGVKVISRQQFNPGGMGNITDLRVTEDELNAARDVTLPQTTPRQFGVDEAPKTPPTTTTLTTKPPISQPSASQPPEYIGILPELQKHNFGFNLPLSLYQQNISQPITDILSMPTPTGVDPGLLQAKTNAGNLVGDLRKYIRRTPDEQFSGQPLLNSFRDSLHGIGDATASILDSAATPIRETLEGIVLNMEENRRVAEDRPDISAKPLPYPKQWLFKRLQNRAINIPNPNLQSR